MEVGPSARRTRWPGADSGPTTMAAHGWALRNLVRAESLPAGIQQSPSGAMRKETGIAWTRSPPAK